MTHAFIKHPPKVQPMNFPRTYLVHVSNGGTLDAMRDAAIDKALLRATDDGASRPHVTEVNQVTYDRWSATVTDLDARER